MRRLPPALLAAALVLPLAACGQKADDAGVTGKILPKTTLALSIAGLGRVKHTEAFGHSYVGAQGLTPSRGFYTLVAKHYRVASQTGGGGATVVDQLDDVYATNLPRRSGPGPQLALVMWGINDIALYGRPVLPAVRNGLESLLSRIRVKPGDAHGYADATVELGSGWSANGTATSTAADAELDLDVSKTKHGGTLGFVAPTSQGTGAVYRFTVDGQAAGRLDTRGLLPRKPKLQSGPGTPFIQRVRIPAGAKTLHVDVTSVQGSAGFYGWHMEATHPPLIVVLHQPRPAGYLAYDGAFHEPDDGDLRALNATTDEAIAAFTDGRVVAADADAELHGDTVFFQDDRLHPTELGHQWLARVTIDAIDAAAKKLRR